MKVEVIKGVKHSVELNFGDISVCINTDEAQNLIAQLRAVVPVPEDVQEAAKAYEDSLDYHECMSQWPSVGYAAGMLAERERLMKEAPVADVIEMSGSTDAEYPFVLTLGFPRIPNIEYHGGKVRVIIEEIKH